MSGSTQAICTLFEGSYHLGVAILANSLAKSGFTGSLYAGYRGPLPPWAASARGPVSMLPWSQAHILPVTDQMDLVFIPLDTSYHLTNYKPDFMQALLSGPAAGVEAIYYFDPDITVTAPWSFFRTWADSGIAVCEDVNSPYAQHHPRRVAWRRYFAEHGYTLTYQQPDYANGGFVGLARQQFGFLDLWRSLQEAMALAIGGLERSMFTRSATPMNAELLSSYYHFNRTDQDALNAALEAAAHPASFMPKAAMGFAAGLATLPHALGSPKPWAKSYWRECLFRGRPPSIADKAFWACADGPLKPYSVGDLKLKRVELKACSALGRFYRQSGPL